VFVSRDMGEEAYEICFSGVFVHCTLSVTRDIGGVLSLGRSLLHPPGLGFRLEGQS
jgi:hypothetical protein